MINKVDILHECHGCDFTRYAGEKSAGLLCIVTYHHEIVVELGKDFFDALSEMPVCPRRWSLVFDSTGMGLPR